MLGVLCLGYSTAWASAPRDAIALLPTISNDTRVITQSQNSDGFVSGYDELQSDWDFNWSPPVISLGTSNLTWGLHLHPHVLDHGDYPTANQSGGVSQSFDFDLHLQAKALDAQHHITRVDSESPGEAGNGAPQSYQSTTSRVAVTLPSSISVAAGQASTVYGGSANINGNASSSEQSNFELTYQPQRPALNQYLDAQTITSSTRNPQSGTSTDNTELDLRAQRGLDLGRIGKLEWDFSHRETASSGDITGGGPPVSDLQETQIVSLNGQVQDTPLSYSASLQDATESRPGSFYHSDTVQQVQLRLAPLSSKHQANNLSFLSRLEQDRQPFNGVDSGDLQTSLTWTLQPHPRVLTTLTYLEDNRTDNLLQRLARDDTRVDLNGSYNLPGTGGTLLLHTWQENQQSSSDANTDYGLQLTNNVNLGKTANLAFDYTAHTNIGGQLPVAEQIATNWISSGVIYDLRASSTVSFHGAWYQDLQVRQAQGFHLDSDRVFLQLTYQPDWKWRYNLTVDSQSAATRDIGPGGDHYADRNNVSASVSFRF